MAEDMVYVEYGRTGIGAGIITGGRLAHGAGGAAGEFGHKHMIEGGPASASPTDAHLAGNDFAVQ